MLAPDILIRVGYCSPLGPTIDYHYRSTTICDWAMDGSEASQLAADWCAANLEEYSWYSSGRDFYFTQEKYKTWFILAGYGT